MSKEELLHGHLELYHHFFSYIKSMALRCATELGIPAAIHRRGGAAMLRDIAADVALHQAKVSHLRRLMRVLTVSGIFGIKQQPAAGSSSSGEAVYTLTPASRLLVSGCGEHDMSPMLRFLVHSTALTPFFSLHAWFRADEEEEEPVAGGGGGGGGAATSLFEMTHGFPRWEMTGRDAAYGAVLNDAMAADSRFVMDVVLREGGGDVFRGLGSLVDVGGGHGAAAAAVARAFPRVKCSVLDLPQVVSQAPPDASDVRFVAGDMFEYIPPADAVLLKYVLHCFGDDDCVKILRRCKEAIPVRDSGGKVIIINMVVGSGSQRNIFKETQALFDLYMMSIDGIEREEKGWEMVFFKAGFSAYKIMPILGFLSVIEVYP
uniref:O-methyltransferase domain-containing protein n=1 Tax=Oryza punctata TaxID=4537 RepID=A0A0E0LAF5_ORYPU